MLIPHTSSVPSLLCDISHPLSQVLFCFENIQCDSFSLQNSNMKIASGGTLGVMKIASGGTLGVMARASNSGLGIQTLNPLLAFTHWGLKK